MSMSDLDYVRREIKDVEEELDGGFAERTAWEYERLWLHYLGLLAEEDMILAETASMRSSQQHVNPARTYK